MKRGKKYKKIVKGLDRNLTYSVEDGVKKVKTLSYSKFNGTLEVHIDVNVPKDKDPKSIKGAYSLPHSSGDADIKIAVFTTKPDAAKKAGADFAGLEDLIKDVQSGKVSFDIAIASPDVMPKIAMLGRELGPKGLMPSPKNGTVTENVVKAVEEYKKGKKTFTCDDSGVIHLVAGKLDMENEKLVENVHACVSVVEDVLNKSASQLINKMHFAPTMGASVKIDYAKPE